MRKSIISLLLLLLITLAAACSSELKADNRSKETGLASAIAEARGISPGTGADLQTRELEQIGPIGQVKRSYEDIQAQYPDKTILKVWGICPSDYITDELNRYLAAAGCDYVVYFVERTGEDIVIDMLDTGAADRARKYEHLLQLLKRADIVPVEREYFPGLVEEGLIDAWNDYLASEDRAKLYSSLPESNWKTAELDGVIYGINGRADYLYGPPSYIVNRELMRKYGITEEDLNKPIYELDDIIEKVAQGERNRQYFTPVTVSSLGNINLHGISPSYIGCSAVFLDIVPEKEALIALEDTEYLKWLEAICRYAKEGLAGVVNNRLDSFFLQINPASALPFTNPNYGFYYNSEGKLADENDLAELVLDKVYQGSISYQFGGFYCNVISGASQSKLQAFDFLNRVYTDPYLTNLLLYGIENRNYRLSAGRVDWPLTGINDNCIGNAYLALPRFFEYPDKEERYKKLQSRYPYVYFDFYFDRSRVEEEIGAVNLTMNKLNLILQREVDDFDKFIGELKRELYDKGIERIMGEIERQKADWLERRKKQVAE